MKSKISAYPYLVWMAIFIIVPLITVIYFAFTDLDGSFTFNNIIELKTYLPRFVDSVFLAAIATLICLVLGYPVAYAISQAKPVKQTFLIMLIMLPMCMSFLLRTLAWSSLLEDNGIINNFINVFGLGRLKMINTPGAVVLGMVYNYIPYMILPLHSVIMKIDNSVIEAAQDLGANRLGIFGKVIIPLSTPGIISGITMVFVPAVSTFYISDKLGGASTQMIGDIIEKQFKQSYNTNLGAAMSLVLMVIVFVCMGITTLFADKNSEVII